MQLVDFRDTCIIRRSTGARDEWDNAVKDLIYEGECLYEEAGTSYAGTMTIKTPTVFLPGDDLQIAINDAIEIVTEQGRTITAIVDVVRDINMPWRSNIKCTRIELKQGQGD